MSASIWRELPPLLELCGWNFGNSGIAPASRLPPGDAALAGKLGQRGGNLPPFACDADPVRGCRSVGGWEEAVHQPGRAVGRPSREKLRLGPPPAKPSLPRYTADLIGRDL